VRLCRFFEGSSLFFDEPGEELRQLRRRGWEAAYGAVHGAATARVCLAYLVREDLNLELGIFEAQVRKGFARLD
jgi:hypothetical protein